VVDTDFDAVGGEEGRFDHGREAGELTRDSGIGDGSNGTTHCDPHSAGVLNHGEWVGGDVRSHEADVDGAWVGGAGLGGEDDYFHRLKLGVAVGEDEGSDFSIGGEVEVGEEVGSGPFRGLDLKRKNKAGAKIARNVEKGRARGESFISKYVLNVQHRASRGRRIHDSSRGSSAGRGWL